jgi:peptidoglycan/xylan/chitin deacetylase (PgdA/CDA1 family)
LRLVAACRAECLGSDAARTDDRTAAPVAVAKPLAPVAMPVLMYHRIAQDGPEALSPWRLSPAAFEAQLKFLKQAGFTTITSAKLGAAMRGERPLPPRPVMLTFDDAYSDFGACAFPLLRRYGMTAELFVVAGKVGGAADWDEAYGPPAPLMGWDEIVALERAGIAIGSHMMTHPHATGLDDESLIREGALSRFTLEARLDRPVTSLALPFGDHDGRVVEALTLCGYRHIYTCEEAIASSGGDPLRIPRFNVAGDTDLSSFARMLGLELPARIAVFA